jgi:hypothetical protein
MWFRTQPRLAPRQPVAGHDPDGFIGVFIVIMLIFDPVYSRSTRSKAGPRSGCLRPITCRRTFEASVFSQLTLELKAGDLCIVGSDAFAIGLPAD